MLKKILQELINKLALFIIEFAVEKATDAIKPKSFQIKRIHELEQKYSKELHQAGISGNKLRRIHFWSQLAHESGLRPIEENLNYNAAGLLRVFSKYFNPVTAFQYQRKPQAIANRVYANRMGNGNEASGDGWKFRGRGFIQTTGRDNYRELNRIYKIDCLARPELLLIEEIAMKAALHFWRKHNLNDFADDDNIRSLTRRINGGLNGLQDRQEKLDFLRVNL